MDEKRPALRVLYLLRLLRLLRLTLLAPDIAGAILNGRQPGWMTLPGVMEPFPVEWAQQEGGPLPPLVPLVGEPNRHRTS